MHRLPLVSGQQTIRGFAKIGYEIVRQLRDAEISIEEFKDLL